MVMKYCVGGGCGCCLSGCAANFKKKCGKYHGYCAKSCRKGERIIEKGCSGRTCVCCAPPCMLQLKCQSYGGKCSQSCQANERKIILGCKNQNKKCKCCAPACNITNSCLVAGGYCVSKVSKCKGYVNAEGCIGDRCMCCLPDKGSAQLVEGATQSDIISDHELAPLYRALVASKKVVASARRTLNELEKAMNAVREEPESSPKVGFAVEKLESLEEAVKRKNWLLVTKSSLEVADALPDVTAVTHMLSQSCVLVTGSELPYVVSEAQLKALRIFISIGDQLQDISEKMDGSFKTTSSNEETKTNMITLTTLPYKSSSKIYSSTKTNHISSTPISNDKDDRKRLYKQSEQCSQ
ncbi:uncharacterized protein LOC119581980 [Penaeus monodon]|uniref:uncharacterized protein LOC119581980 n=1 Tax=Penaeus monodon TaxID=6687 RepID=UPI0018A78AED|nr:uncharacterized protein LOC119581980 [Penaeus monodon]